MGLIVIEVTGIISVIKLAFRAGESERTLVCFYHSWDCRIFPVQGQPKRSLRSIQCFCESEDSCHAAA